MNDFLPLFLYIDMYQLLGFFITWSGLFFLLNQSVLKNKINTIVLQYRLVFSELIALIWFLPFQNIFTDLFFGFGFIVWWVNLTFWLFQNTKKLWNDKHAEAMESGKEKVEWIVSALMGLAIVLTLNATLQMTRLPDPKNLEFQNSSDDENVSKSQDLYHAVTEGQPTFNEFSGFFTNPIAIILGFLAIIFIVKIETERLQNERSHNRKKSQDNLEDVAFYAIELFERFDKKSIDFFIKAKELSALYGLNWGREESWEIFCDSFYDLKSYVIYKNRHDVYISQELIRKFYTYSKENPSGIRIEQLSKVGLDLKAKHEKLRSIHYQSIAKIFTEYSKRKLIDGYSDIEHDVRNIKEYLEEIFIKTDYDISAPKNRCIVTSFQALEQSIHDFNDIQSGLFSKKYGELKGPEISQPNESKASLEAMLKELEDKIKRLNDELYNLYSNVESSGGKNNDQEQHKKDITNELNELYTKKEKINNVLLNIENQPHKEDYNPNENEFIYKLQESYLNGFTSSASVSKFLRFLNDNKEHVQKYLRNYYVWADCDIRYFSEFYEALYKTDRSQLSEVLNKFIENDLNDRRVEEINRKRNVRLGFALYSESNDDEKNREITKRMMDILIKIFLDCKAYYSYFDLLRNLHNLKDAITDVRNNVEKICEDEEIKYLLYNEVIESPKLVDKILNINIEWFSDKNICDFDDLLKKFYDYHRIRESDILYNAIFTGNIKEALEKPSVGITYTKFIQSLFDYLKNNYIETTVWCKYKKDLQVFLNDPKLKDKYDSTFPKDAKNNCT